MLGFFRGKTKGKVICSPCVGNVTPLTEVPDPTFSEKIIGDGFAVIPSEGKIFAPADGEITMTTAAGTELLIHIGLETVTLKGKPFHVHVAAGDQVKQGDLLMEADLDQIREAGLNIISPVVVCNTDDYSQISLLKVGGVSPDEAVLKVE